MGELTCSQPNISWDRLTFSAKESVYKAWFPTYGKWLDFTDCEVMFYLDSHRPNNQPKELVVGRYHAQLLKSKRSYSCNGQWAFVPFFNLLITTTAGSLTESWFDTSLRIITVDIRSLAQVADFTLRLKSRFVLRSSGLSLGSLHHNAIHFFLVKACRKGYRVKLPLDIPFQLHAKDRKVAESLQQPLRQNIGYLCIVLQHDAQGVVVA